LTSILTIILAAIPEHQRSHHKSKLGGMTLSISNSNVFVVANATTDGNANDGNGNGESNASDDGNAST
jgi:hypothetical protein